MWLERCQLNLRYRKGGENLKVFTRSMICSVCSRLLDISPSTITWLSIGTVFFFKQGRYVYKNIMGCKQILHNKLLSPMTESITSLGKPLRSMIFQILISPQVLFRPIKKLTQVTKILCTVHWETSQNLVRSRKSCLNSTSMRINWFIGDMFPTLKTEISRIIQSWPQIPQCIKHRTQFSALSCLV